MEAEVRRQLREALGEAVRFDEPLRRHTSFRIGGPADAWVEASETAHIARAQAIAHNAGVPFAVLGGGSNVLVSDRGIRGIVLKLGRVFTSIEWRPNGAGTYVRAGAAGSFKRLVAEAVRRHLAGLEFGEGIPGTVGGGLLMNAGAFGGEIASVVVSVEGVSATGDDTELPKEQLRFGYRHFDLPTGFVVTRVNFRLAPGEAAVLEERVAVAKEKRNAKQPLGFPNAGSIFKNPPGHFAGRLIEDVGLKGARIGQARFSERHANFIVNLGGATAADVKALMDQAIAAVSERFGVRLEPEVKMLGDWA